MNPTPDEVILMAKIGLAAIFLSLFIAIPFLLRRILVELGRLRETLTIVGNIVEEIRDRRAGQ